MIEATDKILETHAFSKSELMEALYWLCAGKADILRMENHHANVVIRAAGNHADLFSLKAGILEKVTTVNRALRAPGQPMGNLGTKQVNQTTSELVATTKRHPTFTKIWGRLVEPLGRKALDGFALRLLGEIGLAIFYQDYGVVLRRGGQTEDVIMDNLPYTEFELSYFCKTLVNRWGIIFRIGKAGRKGYRLRLRKKDNQTFSNLVEPWVVMSKRNLIVRGGPSDMDG